MVNAKGEWKKEFEKAVHLHQLAINGDKQAAKQAYDLLKKIRLQTVNNALVDAYFGSSSALIARDHPDLMEKMNLAKRGLKALDNAVKADPNNVEIRILRGNVAYRLPEMYFRRTKTAIEDFQFLVDGYEGKKNKISKNQYCEFLLNLGNSYQVIGESQKADTTWDKLLKINSSKFKKLVDELRKNGGV